VSRRLIFTRSETVRIARIAPAVVAVFVEAMDAGELTSAEVVTIVGEAQFAEFEQLAVLRLEPEKLINAHKNSQKLTKTHQADRPSVLSLAASDVL